MPHAFYSNTSEVPARGSRERCVLEASRDVADVAWIDGGSLYLNEDFPNARLRNRYGFDSQDGWRPKPGKAQRFHYLDAHDLGICTRSADREVPSHSGSTALPSDPLWSAEQTGSSPHRTRPYFDNRVRISPLPLADAI